MTIRARGGSLPSKRNASRCGGTQRSLITCGRRQAGRLPPPHPSAPPPLPSQASALASVTASPPTLPSPSVSIPVPSLVSLSAWQAQAHVTIAIPLSVNTAHCERPAQDERGERPACSGAVPRTAVMMMEKAWAAPDARQRQSSTRAGQGWGGALGRLRHAQLHGTLHHFR
eukprot:3933564-Rhodomonas_salina.1